jgi:hypothetical protein
MSEHRYYSPVTIAIGSVNTTEMILAIAILVIAGIVTIAQAVLVGRILPYMSALRLWKAWRWIACIIVGVLLTAYIVNVIFNLASRRETFAAFLFGLITLIIALSLLLIFGTLSTAIILHVSVARAIRSGDVETLNRDIELRSTIRQGRLLHQALAWLDSRIVRSWMHAAMGRESEEE